MMGPDTILGVWPLDTGHDYTNTVKAPPTCLLVSVVL